jgi:hypothetical protein
MIKGRHQKDLCGMAPALAHGVKGLSVAHTDSGERHAAFEGMSAAAPPAKREASIDKIFRRTAVRLRPQAPDQAGKGCRGLARRVIIVSAAFGNSPLTKG